MITPMDIHNKTFSKGLRGYSEEEVNDFLRQIVADYEQIYREHREMEEQMDQMKTKLANYEKISETMTNTLQLAKDTAENVKKNAKRNAEILIANAHAEGDRQIREAEESRRRLVENMIRTEGNMKNYVGKIRKELQLALAAIDALDRIEAPKVAGYPPVEERRKKHRLWKRKKLRKLQKLQKLRKPRKKKRRRPKKHRLRKKQKNRKNKEIKKAVKK